MQNSAKRRFKEKTYGQPFIVSETEADEEAPRREEDESAAGKVDPPKLLPSRLSFSRTDDGVAEVAKSRGEGDSEEGYLEAKSCPPAKRVGYESAQRTAECSAELRRKNHQSAKL